MAPVPFRGTGGSDKVGAAPQTGPRRFWPLGKGPPVRDPRGRRRPQKKNTGITVNSPFPKRRGGQQPPGWAPGVGAREKGERRRGPRGSAAAAGGAGQGPPTRGVFEAAMGPGPRPLLGGPRGAAAFALALKRSRAPTPKKGAG